ncbi:MAG: RNA-binding protein [Apilactobacillus sp.]|uniref:YlmH family RNA-binding protein n=1 Tax=Apilactobacillus TaxID=2767877 RepID=UPI0025FA868E|nr:RNA-binding protein [Apilactobacillus sp.]MCT6823235.1 RNA-binding protein [Apilactobacillus sp.]MCT6857952.1 RNA-binding protein [Apilactobacillus sp.]
MDKNIEQHFRKEEVPFIDSCADLIDESINQYRPVLTKFLNPRQVYILTTLVNRQPDLQIKSFGGYDNAEMKRCLIYPDYFTPTDDDFKLQLFEIRYPVKFSKLRHSKILGTVLGAGIERTTIGDILTDGTHWQFFCTEEIADFIKMQINAIGKTKISLIETPLKEVIVPENDWKDESTTVSSFRMDTLISEGFNISRNDAKELVSHQKVHLNWAVNMRPDYEITTHDVVSVRRYGRLKLKRQDGETKKGKYRAVISVLKK